MRKKPPPLGQPLNKRKPPAKPERSLYERLRDHPLEPLRLSSQQLAELRRQGAWWQEARRALDRELAIRDNLMPAPWMKPNPKPGSAAAWIDELCPKGEWRLMTGKQLYQAIEREAKRRELNKWPSLRGVQNEIAARKKPT